MNQEPPPFDWLRAFHRLSTLARALRGDVQVDTDHRAERERARALRESVEGLGRQIDQKVAEEKRR